MRTLWLRLRAIDARKAERRASRYDVPLPAWVNYSFLAVLPPLTVSDFTPKTGWWMALVVVVWVAWLVYGVVLFRWDRRHRVRRRRVHLLGGRPPGKVAEVAGDRGVVEFPGGSEGTWQRYLRTEDRDAVTGLRIYVSVGTRRGAAASCPTCVDGYLFLLYRDQLADTVASDDEHHTMLIRCRDCGALFNYYPEDRDAPDKLTVDEARRRYPGAGRCRA